MTTEKQLFDDNMKVINEFDNGLISRDLALRAIMPENADHFPEDQLVILLTARKKLKSVPTVDAVEVVRCKDCKWMVEFTGKNSGKPCGYGRCDNPIGLMGIVYDESYCSYSERKTDDLRA